MIRGRLVAVVGLIAIAGCGGSSSHSTTAKAKPLDPLGVATARSFIRLYDRTPQKDPTTLAGDFVDWVTGKIAQNSTEGSPPETALSTSARHAAAVTVLNYARQLVAKGQLPPTMAQGETVIQYLQHHGVGP